MIDVPDSPLTTENIDESGIIVADRGKIEGGWIKNIVTTIMFTMEWLRREVGKVPRVRDVARNNAPRLRRILVRIQGALRGAYSLSVALNATQNKGQKTSKMDALFLATSLNCFGQSSCVQGSV